MINLEDTFEILIDYFIQKDLFLKGIIYSVGIIILIDLLRKQVPEISLLQLVPGFYLFLLFTAFLLILFFSNFIVQYPLKLETKKKGGGKALLKIIISSLLKTAYVFFIITFFIGLNSIIPLSLDSFNSYGEKTIENIWSFNEVLNIEIILLLILFFISQLPLVILTILNNEKEKKKLLKFWKIISFLIFILSGLLTPTIDGYTQLGFAIFAFSFYSVIIIFLGKRINTKYNGTSSLGF
jgi:hypothetical protein